MLGKETVTVEVTKEELSYLREYRTEKKKKVINYEE